METKHIKWKVKVTQFERIASIIGSGINGNSKTKSYQNSGLMIASIIGSGINGNSTYKTVGRLQE